jgi:hypothetical protein
VQFKPGMGAANYFSASDIVMSHSLLMDGVWAGLLAAAYSLKRRNPRGAWVIFGVVLSHWLLDWISHQPDMPLSPGVHRYFGLGLWSSIPAAITVEGGFWLLAIILYARYPCQETYWRLRILDRRGYPDRGVVQQSRRAATSRSPRGTGCQFPLLFLGGRMGLLDEPAPPLAGHNRLTEVRRGSTR